MTENERSHAAAIVKDLIEWARKNTNTEGVQFIAIHPISQAESLLHYLKLPRGNTE